MLKFQILNLEQGTTLVEIIVVILLITLFSVILIADFPRIQKQFTLSRVAYEMAQDLRRAEDMGLSGVADQYLSPPAKGFGIYITLNNPKSYILYGDTHAPFNEYTQNQDFTIMTKDFSPQQGVYIKSINNIDTQMNGTEVNWTSINFSPPNPNVTIENLSTGQTSVDIVLGLQDDPFLAKTISVNKSGLIEIK